MTSAPRIWWDAQKEMFLHNGEYEACIAILSESSPDHWKAIRTLGRQVLAAPDTCNTGYPFMNVHAAVTKVKRVYNLQANLQRSFPPRCAGCRNCFGHLFGYLKTEHIVDQMEEALSETQLDLVHDHLEDCKMFLADLEVAHTCHGMPEAQS